MKKTIFIAIAFGTSIRDVLRNKTFTELKKQYNLDIVILSANYNDKAFQDEFGGSNVFFEPLRNYTPSFFERIAYHLHRAVLHDKCATIRLGNTIGKKGPTGFIVPFIRIARKIISDAAINNILKKLYEKFAPVRKDEYHKLFLKYKPDLVILTRVLNYSMDYPILRLASAMNIPSIVLVSSWDNLTSKGFFPFDINYLIVWNNIIKREAIELFHFPKEKIFVSGIPRYDCFFNLNGYIDKKAFKERLGIQESKRIILYATGSKDTGRSKFDNISPEPEIVKYLAEQISCGNVPDSHLIVRLHPQADPANYEEVFRRKDISVQIPGYKSGFHDRIFKMNDDLEYAATLKYSDVVVNLASTVTIDAAVFNKPIVCVNYDHNGFRPYDQSVKRFYDFDHYHKLREIGGFVLAESKSDLIDQVNQYLQNPSKDENLRQKIVENICAYSDGNSGARVADFILGKLKNDEGADGNI